MNFNPNCIDLASCADVILPRFAFRKTVLVIDCLGNNSSSIHVSRNCGAHTQILGTAHDEAQTNRPECWKTRLEFRLQAAQNKRELQTSSQNVETARWAVSGDARPGRPYDRPGAGLEFSL